MINKVRSFDHSHISEVFAFVFTSSWSKVNYPTSARQPGVRLRVRSFTPRPRGVRLRVLSFTPRPRGLRLRVLSFTPRQRGSQESANTYDSIYGSTCTFESTSVLPYDRKYESTFVRKYNVLSKYFRTFVRKYFRKYSTFESTEVLPEVRRATRTRVQ